MEALGNLMHGFQIALVPINLLYGFIGVFVGTLIGVLPGIGAPAAISLLLPSTFGISPVSAIIMLSGIYYGAMYGGSTTSILVNIPGEAASVVTCLDGYQMARKGRAGPALGISAFGSFIAGTLSIVGLMLLSAPLANAALQFGPPEYFSLICIGLTVLIFLAQGPILKTLQVSLLGLFLSFIGTDVIYGTSRFTLGSVNLLSSVELVPLVVGIFGLSEVLLNIERSISRDIFETEIKGLLPNLKDWMDSKWPIVRGTIIGFFLGILPGAGAIMSSFVSYAVEKRVSRYPEKFGTGVIEGVAGPESANNAATGGSFIPLFSLGIPTNVVLALFLGALMIHGIQPGPLLLAQHPEIFWGTIASMYIGNVMLLLLNLPLIGIWVKILKIPYHTLFPLILLFTLIGSYSTSSNTFDIYSMIFFGIVGYVLRKLEYDIAPLVFAFVLGPMLETNLRQSLILSDGSFLIFLSRPISAVCIIIALVLLFTALVPQFRKKRETLLTELKD
jgi:putative tricarboxylic transport membrane protein